MSLDPRVTAVRLGFDEHLVRRLEARGLLDRVALTDAQIAARIYRASLANASTSRRRRSTKG